jgi:hypothetical protein
VQRTLAGFLAVILGELIMCVGLYVPLGAAGPMVVLAVNGLAVAVAGGRMLILGDDEDEDERTQNRAADRRR